MYTKWIALEILFKIHFKSTCLPGITDLCSFTRLFSMKSLSNPIYPVNPIIKQIKQINQARAWLYDFKFRVELLLLEMGHNILWIVFWMWTWNTIINNCFSNANIQYCSQMVNTEHAKPCQVQTKTKKLWN